MKSGLLEKILKALANKRRLDILSFLKKRKEANVGAISNEINLSFRSTSRHLSVLFMSNMVEREQRNLEVFYRISSECPEIVFKIMTF